MVEPIKLETGWLQPAPGQTKKMDAALQMQTQREHQQKQQQELDQLHNISKDVAANLTQHAYLNAGTKPFPLQTEGETFWDNAKKVISNPLSWGGNVAGTAVVMGAGALGKDTTAPSLRDPWTKAAYLPEQHKYANTEIALGRALAAHPELINKPYLLMTAALSDMQAHDIKYLATMDDMAKIYSTAIMSDSGLKNASESMYKRIMANPGASVAQGIGGGLQKAIDFTGNLQTDLEAILASAAGRTVKKVGGGKGMQPASLNISGGEGITSAIFGGAQTAVNVTSGVLEGIWRNTGEHLFGIQHAIRTENHIRRTQGDAQANLYLGTWFSTAVMLNFAAKGFAVGLKGLEAVGLKSMLEKAGISGAEKATLEQLHILAQGAKIGDKRWIRLIQASQDWLMHASTNAEVRNKLLAAYARRGMDEPMLGRYGREALNVAEDASGAERAGAFITRNLSPTGKVLKDVATYGARHYHIPLNLELAAQLVSNTNGFALGHEWDKSWERTTDGTKYKDPITHAPISFGREVASAVGGEPNTWWYNMVSGPLDFLSWFEFDPFQAILTPISETKQLENTGMLKRVYGGIGIRSATDVYNLAARSTKFRSFVEKVVDVNKEAIPHRLETAEQLKKTRLEAIAKTTARMEKKGMTQAQIDVRLAASRIQPLTDAEAALQAIQVNPKASSIARLYKNFPELASAVRPSELEAGENFIKLLSEAQSKDEVVELFASAAKAHQYLNTYRAPSYSRFMSAKDWARVQVENRIENKTDKLIAEGRYADAAKAGLDNKFYRMFTSMKPVYWDEMRKFSNEVVKIGDPKSLDMMGRMFRASGVDPLTTDLLINRLAMSKSAQEWKNVYWNWAQDTFSLYVESQLQEIVVKSGMTVEQSNQIRNLLSTSFKHAAEELGNPFGGGGARNVYSGADVNGVVNAKRPFPEGGDMTETAGLGVMHEHYLPLFNYNAIDNIVRDVSKYLKSTDGRKEIVKAVDEMLAKPLTDKLADVQKQMNAIEINYTKMKVADGSSFTSDPAWLLLKEKTDKLQKDKSDLISAATGDYRFYDIPDRMRMSTSNGLHSLHTMVRQRLIDDYFRKMTLATGSFSMRVSASEAIPNAFRVGVGNYTKAALSSHVERAARQYAKDYKRVVTPDEMGYTQKRVYDLLTKFGKEDIEFYGKNFPSEVKRYTRRLERDFVKGLTSGKSFDKFVQRMTKDILINGYSVGGLSADHADVYAGGRDAIGAQFRNLVNGHGSGPWAPNGEMNTNTLAGLGKVWQDITHDPIQRTTAKILDDYLDPAMGIAPSAKTVPDNHVSIQGNINSSTVEEKPFAVGSTSTIHGAKTSLNQNVAIKRINEHEVGDVERHLDNEGTAQSIAQAIGAPSMEVRYFSDTEIAMPKLDSIDAPVPKSDYSMGSANFMDSKNPEWTQQRKEDMRRNLLLDAFSGADRHHANYVFTKDGHVFSIDHAQGFNGSANDIAASIDDALAKGEFTREEINAISASLKNATFKNQMRPYPNNYKNVLEGWEKGSAEYAKSLPAAKPSNSFQERLDAATKEIHKVTKQMVRKNPALFDNIKRSEEGSMLPSTRDRIANELLSENGLPANTPITGRLDDQLKERLQKVDSLEEWANANIQHILWATHGRGSTGGFSFPNMGDRVFHRRILSMLGSGEAPTKVNEVEKLIITPDAEHARVLQHIRGSVKSKGGGESLRYHDALYHPSATFHDEATFNSLTEGAETIPKLIKKQKPTATNPLQRASSRKATVKGTGLRERYGDTSGKVHALFPDNIPVQMGNGYDAPNFIDRFSDRVHDTVSRRVIDSVARRPLYAVELNAQLDFLEPLIKSGAITEDLAFSIAQSRAINQGIKYVHNPQDRMLFEQWSRAYAPFWFAQNQALRRMGRLALQNPAAFEKYMLLQLMFMQSGATAASSIDSQNSALIPGSTLGGRIFTDVLKSLGLSPSGNVPIGLTGSLTSLNSVFPWNDPSGLHTGSPTALLEHLRPQFGPLVSLPLKAMESIWPYGIRPYFTHMNISTRKINESVLGDVGANVGTMHAAIPNPAIRALVGTAISAATGGRVTDSELTSPITSIQYGLIPQYYADKSNEVIGKAKAQAQKDWNVRWGGPEAAAANPDGYKTFIQDETMSYMLNGYEDPNNPNLGFKGLAEYWKDPVARHALANDTSLAAQIIYLGRTFISFFSPVSTQTTQVQPELQKFIHDLYGTNGETQKILDLVKKHPEAISFIEATQSASTLGIPLDASINMAIYSEQNKDLFTNNKLTAGVAMLLPYHKKGSERDSHEYNLQKNSGLRSKYTPDDYIKNIARQTGNWYMYEYLPQMTQDLYGGDDTRQRELAAEHAKQNIPWKDALGQGRTHRQEAFASLERVLQTKGIDSRPGLKETAPLARQLISDYRGYQSDLAQAMPGNYDVIQGNWQQHVEDFRKKNPVASVLIDSLFKNLSLRDVK